MKLRELLRRPDLEMKRKLRLESSRLNWSRSDGRPKRPLPRQKRSDSRERPLKQSD